MVAPSLPGYGFSSAPKSPGFGIRQMAATMNEAMLRLGYERYVAQGGMSFIHSFTTVRGMKYHIGHVAVILHVQ